MTAKTLRLRLQNQYNKLNNRIQKSIKTGRFYQYTQFKRDQLFARLERYSMQMKRLSMGLGIVAALGVATPVVGQAPNFIERTGALNPCDTMPGNSIWKLQFADLDGDGDLDLFRGKYEGSNLISDYYENTGTVNSPLFIKRVGANNPLDVLLFTSDLEFVDIDGDGDLDLFGGGYSGYDRLTYYQNTGTATNPNLVKQSSHNLNNAVTYLNNNNAIGNPSFVDIDNDGDFDCFIGTHSSPNGRSIIYYENTGFNILPNFVQRTGVDHPLDIVNGTFGPGARAPEIEFHDMDGDGDKDAFIDAPFSSGNKFIYYENTGTNLVPNFQVNTVTPLDSIANLTSRKNLTLVDIDDDSDLDVFESIYNPAEIKFHENLDTTIVSTTFLAKAENHLEIYPNPTSGKISFDNPVSGTVVLYSLNGQELWAKELYNENSIEFRTIENGLYILTIEQEDAILRKKVVIQK